MPVVSTFASWLEFASRSLKILLLIAIIAGPAPTTSVENPPVTPAPAEVQPVGDLAKGAEMAWVASTSFNGIAYFAFATPPRIERFDLASEFWMTPLSLSETPYALTVDSSAIFVGFARRVIRMPLEGGEETHLRNTGADINSLVTIGEYLYIHWGEEYFTSCHKASGSFIDSQELNRRMRGVSVAPSLNKIFARSVGVSPSDILEVNFNVDGTIGIYRDSPYHGDFTSAARTFVFPGETRVADDSGIVYSTNGLVYTNSLAGSFDDMAFYFDLPVVLRGDELFSYSNVFLETGKYTLGQACQRIFIESDRVYAAFLQRGEVEFEVIPIDRLTPATPGEPVDPTGAAYDPDDILLDRDGTVHLLSPSFLSVFRWSPVTTEYLESIPLHEVPGEMAYSEVTHRLYIGYNTGRITQVDLLEERLSETSFVNTPGSVRELATAWQYVFVCDESSNDTHITYRPDGILIGQDTGAYFSQEYTWSSLLGRLYYLRDDASPNDVLWRIINPDGTLGLEEDSPEHSSTGISHPVRVSPNGSYVVLGSGRVHDAISLAIVDYLPNIITDMTWIVKEGGVEIPYAIRTTDVDSQVQKFGETLGETATASLPGDPLRLFTIGDRILAITSVGGIPVFHLLDENLGLLFSSPLPIPTATPSPTVTFTPSLTKTPGSTATPTAQPEDINEDGHINDEDLLRLLRMWHQGWKDE